MCSDFAGRSGCGQIASFLRFMLYYQYISLGRYTVKDSLLCKSLRNKFHSSFRLNPLVPILDNPRNKVKLSQPICLLKGLFIFHSGRRKKPSKLRESLTADPFALFLSQVPNREKNTSEEVGKTRLIVFKVNDTLQRSLSIRTSDILERTFQTR
jgi:hypothetical protein